MCEAIMALMENKAVTRSTDPWSYYRLEDGKVVTYLSTSGARYPSYPLELVFDD